MDGKTKTEKRKKVNRRSANTDRKIKRRIEYIETDKKVETNK